jgi:hypothetical protein
MLFSRKSEKVVVKAAAIRRFVFVVVGASIRTPSPFSPTMGFAISTGASNQKTKTSQVG